MNQPLDEYIESHITPETPLLKQITRSTFLHQLNAHMISGHIQGRVLSMLSHMIQPKHILELGTFTGYSALCLAEGLSDDGMLYTIEHNDELEDTILSNISVSQFKDHISSFIGDAVSLLQSHPTLSNPTLIFDLVFIDADKREYINYFNSVIPRVRKGGFILADNTLWDGHIVDPLYDKDHQTVALRAFNDYLLTFPNIEVAILPIRDGITLIRKIA